MLPPFLIFFVGSYRKFCQRGKAGVPISISQRRSLLLRGTSSLPVSSSDSQSPTWPLLLFLFLIVYYYVALLLPTREAEQTGIAISSFVISTFPTTGVALSGNALPVLSQDQRTSQTYGIGDYGRKGISLDVHEAPSWPRESMIPCLTPISQPGCDHSGPEPYSSNSYFILCLFHPSQQL